jgi:hypothetical protein
MCCPLCLGSNANVSSKAKTKKQTAEEDGVVFTVLVKKSLYAFSAE